MILSTSCRSVDEPWQESAKQLPLRPFVLGSALDYLYVYIYILLGFWDFRYTNTCIRTILYLFASFVYMVSFCWVSAQEVVI
ncbi:hypothetical protein Scep_021979 [Stephania cephalantha]|uniref:Uncharacterized protein n=1 Tax=Stephania cephalantha TaxID=152367 RepID=A0AAP0I1W4_9MAGN